MPRVNPGAGSLLLVLPLAFRETAGGELLVEKQACNGIERWADHFERIRLACPVEPEHPASRTTQDYLPASAIRAIDRVELVPLRARRGIGGFLAALARTRGELRRLIEASDYLSFAIGGLIGDWGSVAALEAKAAGRAYSVWTDRVEHQVVKLSYRERSGLRRAFRFVRDRLIVSPLMKRLERHVIRHAALGLFHGRDCFDAYAPFSANAHLVHDIHLKTSDQIPSEALQQKLAQVRSDKPLRLLYVGRVAAMKGPEDWLEVMSRLKEDRIPFEATWLGDGPLLEAMRARNVRQALADQVRFPGYVGDRQEVLRAMRDADLFVFCHKTPESPRCLIEAIVSAAPLVGYGSAYSEDLLGELAPGLLSRDQSPAAVAARIGALHRDRAGLAARIQACFEKGRAYSDEAVFAHRAALIKQSH